ncbi:unnamed protein product [Brassicogethes aeneus]|uniref:Maestro heat-like repeat-containing protein family member 1 n=1 Tax=Brassicogethes aeneus TaxID=1431903 RepID=A0A9P0FJ36_BRAAE|nr:unnamed protein product [Brassicogethes aeneus]
MNGNLKQNAESQLQVAIGILLCSVADKSPLVVDTVNSSLKKLADKHPNQVLNCCITFCTKAKKPSNEHIAAILEIMETVCTDNIATIDGDSILAIIEFSLNVMVETSGLEPLVQKPASGILVALGREHYIQVMESLLKKLQAGVVPHYMIPHTLGSLANVNPYGVVPYLKNILNIILPLIGNLRPENLRTAFSFAIGSFCNALVEYCANIDQVPDSTISIENFNVEIGMAYDVLFSSWLQTRDPKVAEAVLNAISDVFPVLSVEKVSQQTPKVINTLLSLYKRNGDSYTVTKCLGAVVQKAATVNGTLLEPLLANVLHSLSDLVCISPDYAKPESLRGHFEVLRCYECFALYFTDSTMDQLLNQLKNNNERERIKSLIVLTHLVSYSGENTISRRFKDVLKLLNDLLNDPSIRVKRALVKIIVAFAIKKVLLNKECNPEGPMKYMEFILKMCCKQTIPKNNDLSPLEMSDIQKSADNTLYMLSTSVPELENILWILLLQCFLGPVYDDAVVILLRCLTHLASKRESVGSCEAAFVRCLGLLADPLPAFRGTFILNFLRNIKPCELEGYKPVWDSKIPQLIKYLEQNYDNLNYSEWHDLLFDFVSLLLQSVKSESFSEIIVFQSRKQLEIYNNNRYMSSGGGDLNSKQMEKKFLLKCLAITLCSLNDKETVLQTLENILVNVRLNDYKELHTAGEAIGICSRSHLQIVLDKLSDIRKNVLLKKSSKFFSFIKDQKHDLDIERLRYAVIYSYSEVCNEAPAEKLLQVIESNILEYILTELAAAKDFQIRKACLIAISSIADAMHPNRNSLHIRLNERDRVVDLVSAQIQLHNGQEYIELFPGIISAITSLVKLPLPLESEERIKLLKLFFDNVFNAAAIYCKINTDNRENYYGDLKMVPHITKSFAELNLLVQELMLQSLSPATLDEIATLLEPWLSRKKQEQRHPACDALKLVLQTYLNNMKFAYDCPSTFGQTGSVLAHIIPRCTDPNKNIRKIAVECVCLTLCIAARYEGHMKDHDKVLTNSLQHIQHQIESDDPKLLYNLTSDLAHVVCINMPQFQLIHLVDGLSDGLLDCESSSSNGTGVVLSMTLKNKGGELQSQVSNILEKLLKQLGKIQCQRTRSSTLRGILNLATHHSKIVGSILLAQPLPYDNNITDAWNILSVDQTLVLDLIDQLKKIIKQTPMYEEQSKDIKVVNLQSLQAVCALQELVKNGQLKDTCVQQFPEIFSLLLVCLASYMGTTVPAYQGSSNKKDKYGFLNRESYKMNPCKVAIDTMRLFFLCCDYKDMATLLLSYNHLETSEDPEIFLEVTSKLVEGITEENPQALSWLVACLGPFIRAEQDPQRMAAVAFFTYLLKQKANEQTVLVENLLEMILDVQSDQSCIVRKIALQGLGYAAELSNTDLISRHCNPILSVMMNSLDYNIIGNESSVILEGMQTFSKLLTALEGYKFSSFQVTAAVRIKPLLGQEDVHLRRASFKLLGDLTASLNSEANMEAFKEQIHGNVITLMLHLCDPDVTVIKACKYTLRKVGPHLNSPKVNCMIQEHLIDEANLHFSDFIKDLIKLMAEEVQDLFPLLVMTCLSYFKSQWVEIRSNAALVSGLLYSQLAAENKNRVSVDTVCDRLMKLLTDENETVRMRAVEAMAYLFLN